MWESPVYKFEKMVYDDNKQASVQEIVVNVTGSAPNMKVPGDYLTGVLNILTENKTPRRTKILDVGAAKLRNTLFLLDKGFQLYAVEYPELYTKMRQTETNLELAEKYPNFNRLIFPKDFFQLDVKIDIALLINVINVMPIPEERLILLTLCREKMREKGILLWYNWQDIASNVFYI